MTRKTILATVMVIAVIAASITTSSIAYAAQDPKPKDIAKSFFDIFTERGYTPNSFFDVFTELRGDVGNLESQVADIQSQIGSGGSAQSVRMFMQIEGIPGESTDKDHMGAIDVESWSWGATQSGSASSGGGGGSGKVSFHDLSFVHKYDKASPKLFLATAKGEHIGKVELTVRKSGDTPLEYIKITMSDVIISGVSPSASGNDIPTEEVTMNFASIKIEYKPQNPAPGESEPPVTAEWDLNANQGT